MPSPSKAIFALCLSLLISGRLLAYDSDPGKSASAARTPPPKPQTTCPVMGGPIDKALFVDVKGKRIYLCCAACEDAIRAEPDKYIKKIEKRGQTVENAPSNE